MKTSDWIWLGLAGAGIALLLSKKSSSSSSTPPPTPTPSSTFGLTSLSLLPPPSPVMDSPLQVTLETHITDDLNHIGYRQINWRIWMGNPTSVVLNGNVIITLDGVVKGEPYVAIGDLSPGLPYGNVAMGGYNTLAPGETHTICIKPKDPTVATWTPICNEVVT